MGYTNNYIEVKPSVDINDVLLPPDTRRLIDHLLKRFPAQFRQVKRRYGISYAEAEVDVTFQVKAQIISEAELCENKNEYG